ncbi:thiamine-phosphate synthase [Thiomicrorhabdus immobilis]|uniref:Thiamine-phosphate synthase n=1 Tax=Thiomicrorhabdus immobilis TaxID=2791037 RepID=A0ABM7ME97_9GAMM|nr:thiamine phosphate synthase [Thiomicrorhabdus immobilis]BCN93686.1 thiamine-phosphate synthase [Thiomicrorhabdus immobilis]
MDSSLTNPSKISGLYVITDTNLMDESNLIEKVRLSLKGGAKIVQFRDKVSNQNTKLNLAKQLKQLCQSYQAWFIINDDIQLAKQIAADGVHIGKDDQDIIQARKQLGDKAIIGVSCYNDLERASQMQALGASYVAFGRFFPSKTKPDAPQADLATLQKAKTSLTIPIVAIGGITAHNAQSLIDAGADSVAVIQGVFASENIQSQSQQIQDLFC